MKNETIHSFHQGIRIDRIPASGFAGLLFTLATMVTFLSLPAVREFLIAVLVVAVPMAAMLHYWHTQTRW